MSLESGKKPRKNDAIVLNDDPETPSFLNPMNGQIFVSNVVGKTIVELADGQKNVDDIVTALTKRFKGADEGTIRNDVETFLKQGTEKGVILWD